MANLKMGHLKCRFAQVSCGGYVFEYFKNQNRSSGDVEQTQLLCVQEFNEHRFLAINFICAMNFKI